MPNNDGGAAPVGEFSTPYKWTKNDPLWIPVLSDELQARYEKLKADLDVERVAHLDGVSNLPAADETTLNDVQSGIQNRIFRGIYLLNAFLAQQLDKAYQGMTSPDLEIDIKARKDEADAAMAGAIDADANLITACLNKLQAERHLNFFRVTHHLTHRPADYRESGLLFFAVLIGLAVLESFANATLLQEVSAQGWLGGVMIALMISAINVFLGVLGGGVGWRLLGHRYWWAKTIGAIVTVLSLGSAIVWNFIVAHFREVAVAAVQSQSSVDLSGSAIGALEHIREHGVFGLEAILSWLLLVLGILVYLFVCREAWDGMADRYWDYKRVDKRCADATEEYDEEYSDFRADLDERLEDLHAGVAEDAAACLHDLKRADAAAGLAEQRFAEVQESQAQWVNQGNRLLKYYRDENDKVRNPEAGVPAYWNQFPTAQEYLAGRFDGGQVPSEAETATIERVPQVLQDIRGRRGELRAIQVANQAAVIEVQRYIQELKKKIAEDVGTLKANVESAARERLRRRGGEADERGDDGAIPQS